MIWQAFVLSFLLLLHLNRQHLIYTSPKAYIVKIQYSK